MMVRASAFGKAYFYRGWVLGRLGSGLAGESTLGLEEIQQHPENLDHDCRLPFGVWLNRPLY